MKNNRGYAAIGLHQCKDPSNIGGVLRAAGCYGAAMVGVSGYRYQKYKTDTQKAYKHLPVISCDDLREIKPYNVTVVAVDLIEYATPLPKYTHPESAFYIFGPEDGTLDSSVLSWCHDVIYIPTHYCMNLAATVNVVLYDRLTKMV